MDQNKFLQALPLYEHLAAQQPGNMLFAERLAFCLTSQLAGLPTGPERSALLARARAEAERARSLGDSSALLQTIMDALSQSSAERKTGNPKLDAAEAAFRSGDLDSALAGYQAVADADPKSYEARLYAGDVYYRKHDLKLAGEWFQRAIAVDPDQEIAYRYWGDALAAGGEQEAALARFIDAVVAEPYSRKPWSGLTQWAMKNGATLQPPHVPVPKAPAPTEPSAAKPGATINFDPGMTKDPKASAAWLAYSANRALWRNETFAKRYPKEKTYRHSLAEEVESLQMALKVLGEPDKSSTPVDASVRDLVELGQEGMIEAYVLLNAADAGIAVDYPAYRAAHREKLHAYLERLLIHRSTATN
jgi:tetratricopeptide (TPR) repeat protein